MKVTVVKIFTITGLIGLLATGCVTPSGRPDNTGTGALVGGATGASIGALATHGDPAAALIGGAAGLIAGAFVGHAADEQNEARREYAASHPAYVAVPATPAAQPLSIAQVKSLAKSGVSDDNIIGQINSTHTVYHLDATAIIDLSNSGVSQKVISYMISSPNTVVAQAPPTPQAETIVAAPGPDYTYVNGEWVWNGATWVWVSGRWVVGPYPHAVWISARWEYGPYGWHRIPGRWR